MLESFQVFYLSDQVSVQDQNPQVLQVVALCDEGVYLRDPVEREVYVVEVGQADQVFYLCDLVRLQIQMAQLLLTFE